MFRRCLGIAILVMSLYSSIAIAIDCGPADVISIQSQKGNVLIRMKTASWDVWNNLGPHSSVSTNSYQAIAQQAMAAGQKVYLRFADGHDCAVTDYSTQPDMIRVSK